MTQENARVAGECDMIAGEVSSKAGESVEDAKLRRFVGMEDIKISSFFSTKGRMVS
jgi:hypothetical protein